MFFLLLRASVSVRNFFCFSSSLDASVSRSREQSVKKKLQIRISDTLNACIEAKQFFIFFAAAASSCRFYCSSSMLIICMKPVVFGVLSVWCYRVIVSVFRPKCTSHARTESIELDTAQSESSYTLTHRHTHQHYRLISHAICKTYDQHYSLLILFRIVLKMRKLDERMRRQNEMHDEKIASEESCR